MDDIVRVNQNKVYIGSELVFCACLYQDAYDGDSPWYLRDYRKQSINGWLTDGRPHSQFPMLFPSCDKAIKVAVGIAEGEYRRLIGNLVIENLLPVIDE